MEQIQDVSDVERLAGSLGPLPEPAARPALVVMSGLPGTGKTYFCDRLSKRLPLVILESDSLRKVLFSSPTYSAEESFHLFQTIHRLIEQLLRKRVSLILDATNLSERHREYLYSIANRLDVKLVLARVKAPPKIVQARLKRRLEHPEGNSDADWATYQKMKASVETIHRQHYTVDTSQDITPTLDKLVKEIES